MSPDPVQRWPRPDRRPGLVPPAEIAPGVFHSAISGSNVYFVRSGSSWVLIDTSWPNRGPLIKQTAEPSFGVGTCPATILLTHAHPDHAGSALELARSWDLPVYVHPAELPLAAGKYLPEYGDPIGRLVDRAVYASHAPA